MTPLAALLLLAAATNAQFAGDAAAGAKREIATTPTNWLAQGDGGPRGSCGTQGGGAGTCRVFDAGGARYSRGRGRVRGASGARGRRGFRICGARDAAGRTLRAADGIGRTRGGLTPSRAQKSFPPLEMIWITSASG